MGRNHTNVGNTSCKLRSINVSKISANMISAINKTNKQAAVFSSGIHLCVEITGCHAMAPKTTAFTRCKQVVAANMGLTASCSEMEQRQIHCCRNFLPISLCKLTHRMPRPSLFNIDSNNHKILLQNSNQESESTDK